MGGVECDRAMRDDLVSVYKLPPLPGMELHDLQAARATIMFIKAAAHCLRLKGLASYVTSGGIMHTSNLLRGPDPEDLPYDTIKLYPRLIPHDLLDPMEVQNMIPPEVQVTGVTFIQYPSVRTHKAR